MRQIRIGNYNVKKNNATTHSNTAPSRSPFIKMTNNQATVESHSQLHLTRRSDSWIAALSIHTALLGWTLVLSSLNRLIPSLKIDLCLFHSYLRRLAIRVEHRHDFDANFSLRFEPFLHITTFLREELL